MFFSRGNLHEFVFNLFKTYCVVDQVVARLAAQQQAGERAQIEKLQEQLRLQVAPPAPVNKDQELKTRLETEKSSSDGTKSTGGDWENYLMQPAATLSGSKIEHFQTSRRNIVQFFYFFNVFIVESDKILF